MCALKSIKQNMSDQQKGELRMEQSPPFETTAQLSLSDIGNAVGESGDFFPLDYWPDSIHFQTHNLFLVSFFLNTKCSPVLFCFRKLSC